MAFLSLIDINKHMNDITDGLNHLDDQIQDFEILCDDIRHVRRALGLYDEADDYQDVDLLSLNVEISTNDAAIEIDLADSISYEQTFPKLQDMAAIRLTLDMCNCACSCRKTRCYCWDHEKKFNKNLENLVAPRCIKKKMKMLYRCIKLEIDHFNDSNLRALFDHKEEELLDEYNLRPLFQVVEENNGKINDTDNNKEKQKVEENFYFNFVVWKSNCRIDKKNTVEKLLSRRKKLHLYGDLVFEISANHCMENYLKSIPVSFLSARLIEDISKYKDKKHRMTYYWMKSKDTEFTSQLRDIFTILNRSLRVLRDPFEWRVYEYFWDFLTDKEQLKIAKKIISNHRCSRYQMDLFSKMNRNQLGKIYSELPYNIISNFCSLSEYELARASWHYAYANYMISNEQFQKLIEQVLNKAKLTGEGTDFLSHLWSNAAKSMITYATNMEMGQITDVYFRNNYALVDTMDFLIAILQRKSDEFKKNFILSKGLNLLSQYDEKIFTMIEACFNQNDQLEIKEKLLVDVVIPTDKSTMRRFTNLLLWKNEEFYRYLSLFTTKPNLQQLLKRRLVESKMIIISEGFFTAKEWSNVSKLLDESYPSREQARRRKKKLLYSSVDGFYIFQRWPQPNDEANFTVIDAFLQSVLTRNEIVNFKQRVSICFQTALVNGYRPPFKKFHWCRFISWCYNGDEEKISEFRLSFPIHDAFHTILRETVNSYVKGEENCGSFFSINELVRWKFPDSNERKKFKELKIYDIMGVNLQKIPSTSQDYNEIAEKLIQWFFEENKAKIRQFKKIYTAKDRLKMIRYVMK